MNMCTCSTCKCWHRIGESPVTRRIVYDTGTKIVPAGAEGECRLGAPPEDFRWPLTNEKDFCASHRSPDRLPLGCPPPAVALPKDLQLPLTTFPEAGTGAPSPSSMRIAEETDDAENRQPEAQPLQRRQPGARGRRPVSGNPMSESNIPTMNPTHEKTT
jgi:hypothetical protein